MDKKKSNLIGPVSFLELRRFLLSVKNVEKCRHRLATNRKIVEKELKKPQQLFDDFLENFVFDIDDHEELCNLTGGRKEMAKCFMDKVLASVEKGSYDLLLHILKTEMCKLLWLLQFLFNDFPVCCQSMSTFLNIFN
jgi:hypothetical protein